MAFPLAGPCSFVLVAELTGLLLYCSRTRPSHRGHREGPQESRTRGVWRTVRLEGPRRGRMLQGDLLAILSGALRQWAFPGRWECKSVGGPSGDLCSVGITAVLLHSILVHMYVQ